MRRSLRLVAVVAIGLAAFYAVLMLAIVQRVFSVVLLLVVTTGVANWCWRIRPAELRRSRLNRGQCGACGYDLTANTSGVCPGCGASAPVPPSPSATA